MMFEIYKFSEIEIISFILVLVRVSAFLVTMPLIGSEQVPGSLKVLTSLVLTFLVFPTVLINNLTLREFNDFIIWLALKEALLGVILGFISRLFFFALTIAGEVISLSIGLSSEQLLNPAVGGRSTAIQQFQVLLGIVFFLTINGHYYLISGIVKSFEVIPLSMQGVDVLSAKQVASLGQEIIWSGIRMAAPVMAAIFFMNVAMGVMGRAVPQINVLITSLPVNVLVGFVVIIISIPLLLANMDGLASLTATRLFQVLKEL